MKSLISIFVCCLFFVSSSIAQTLSFPKAIGYTNPTEKSGEKLTEADYLEPIDFFVQTFRPIGWSTDGKFAYANFSIDHNSDLIMSVFVQDMVSDDIVWEDEYSLEKILTSEGNLDKTIDKERWEEILDKELWSEVPEKQLWDALKHQISKKLEKYKIHQEKKVDFRRGTWHRINGQPYKFDLKTRSTEVTGYMGEIHVDCRAKGLGEKTILEGYPVDYKNEHYYYVAGISKSPYQDRVAVVCHFRKTGFDNSTDTYCHLIGCNLKNGFK
ncbi:MAG: hypothetical protein GY810_23180 [Aureispira sp.]|nr:hypothetical protein [Aureispira sp.]